MRFLIKYSVMTVLLLVVLGWAVTACADEDPDGTADNEPQLVFAGCIEAEYGYANTRSDDGTERPAAFFGGGDSESESDLVLATFLLEWTATMGVNELYLGWLYEDGDDTPGAVDEVVFTTRQWESWSFSLGQAYLPWGTFNTSMVSDPMTLELGELRYVYGGIDYEWEHTAAHFAVFRGPGSSDNSFANDFAISLDGEVPEQGAWAIGYLSDMSAGPGFENATEDIERDSIPGVQVSGELYSGDWTFRCEYLGALQSTDPAWLDFDTDGSGDLPRTAYFQIERQFAEHWTAGVHYGKSWQFAGFPSTRLGLTVQRELSDGMSIGGDILLDNYSPAWAHEDESKVESIILLFSCEF